MIKPCKKDIDIENKTNVRKGRERERETELGMLEERD
jgi:hypothetical protein